MNICVMYYINSLLMIFLQEANNMVQDANIKRMHSEKLLIEAHQQVGGIAKRFITEYRKMYHKISMVYH